MEQVCGIIQRYTRRKPFDSLVRWLPTARPLFLPISTFFEDQADFIIKRHSSSLHPVLWQTCQFWWTPVQTGVAVRNTNDLICLLYTRCLYCWLWSFYILRFLVFVLCEFTKENCVEMAELASCVRGMQLWTSQLEILINITLSTLLVLEMNYVSMQTAWFYSPRT